MNDTPRTNAAQKWLFSLGGQMQTLCVHQEFARQLERELVGANTALKLMTEANAKLERELNEVKQVCGDRYPDARMLELVHSLRRELAEAIVLRDKNGEQADRYLAFWNKSQQDRNAWRKCAEELAKAVRRSDGMLEGRGVGWLIDTRVKNKEALDHFNQLKGKTC